MRLKYGNEVDELLATNIRDLMGETLGFVSLTYRDIRILSRRGYIPPSDRENGRITFYPVMPIKDKRDNVYREDFLEALDLARNLADLREQRRYFHDFLRRLGRGKPQFRVSRKEFYDLYNHAGFIDKAESTEKILERSKKANFTMENIEKLMGIVSGRKGFVGALSQDVEYKFDFSFRVIRDGVEFPDKAIILPKGKLPIRYIDALDTEGVNERRRALNSIRVA